MDALAGFTIQDRYDLPEGQAESFHFSEIRLFSGGHVYRETAATAKIAVHAVC